MSDEVRIPEAHAEILAANSYGVISTMRHKDGLISSNPVGYVWDGECIRISSIKDRVKYQNLCANPLVAFCVVDSRDHTRYVELRGSATIVEDPDREFFGLQFRENSGGEEAPEDIDPPGTERVILRIHPQKSSSPLLYGGRFTRE